MGGRSILDELENIAEGIQRGFQEERRVLAFEEYLELFETDPVRYTRDASRYLRDMFDYYGQVEVEHPWGK